MGHHRASDVTPSVDYTDFTQLATKHTYLSEFLRDGKFQYSYRGQCALTKAVLKDRFDVDIEILEGHLIPAIPSRVAYLDIVKRVLFESGLDTGRVRGLDVGTGAYAVYAILGAKSHGWEMVGIDTDTESVRHAEKIVRRNGIHDVRAVECDGLVSDVAQLIALTDRTIRPMFDFMMCNPPFYQTLEEMAEKSRDKRELKREPVIGTAAELVFQGGEVAFVKRLIDSSKRDDCIWYSSLFGLRSSVQLLIDHLIEVEIHNFHVQTYQLGNTRRWILFWSHRDYHPRVYRNDSFKNVPITVQEGKYNLDQILKVVSALPVEIKTVKDGNDVVEITVSAPGVVWSRAYRRHPERMKVSPSKFVISTHEIFFSRGRSMRDFQSFHTYVLRQLAR